METDATNTPLVPYTLGNGQLISQERAGVTSYYLPNVQGSTRALTDATGTITDTFNYMPFGDILDRTGRLPPITST
jgi:hypothetical protein